MSRINEAFQALKVEIADHGGLFGYVGQTARAFCDVVGQSPATSAVVRALGNAIAFEQISMPSAKKLDERLGHNPLPGFVPAN